MSVPVTERLYEGPPLRDVSDAGFTARVVAVAERDGQPAVALDRTQFYPTGGGQPCDLGTLGGRRVLAVEEDEPRVWHLLDGDDPPWPVDTEVAGRVDLPRRQDHMQQHSGQHLLSAVLLDEHGIETRSFHLGEALCTIDVACAELAPETLAAVESAVNARVRAGLPVITRVHQGPDAIAAACVGLRKQPEAPALSSPRGLRIVQLGPDDAPLDRDPCCGTHVASTGELGLVLLLGSERARKGETRVTFVAGARAVAELRRRLDALHSTAADLSVGYLELPARAGKLLGEVKALRKQLDGARRELLELRAVTLAAEAEGDVIEHLLEQGPPADAATLARGLVAARPTAWAAVAHRGEKATLVLAAGARAPDLDLGPLLRELLAPHGGKGGGKGSFAQGAAPDPQQASTLLQSARERLRELP